MTNEAYYRAEDDLQSAIRACPHDELVRKVSLFLKASGTETNREFFQLFGIVEDAQVSA